LTGNGGDVSDHRLQIRAGKTLQLDANHVPTGEFEEVGKGEKDFREARSLRVKSSGQSCAIDNSFVLDQEENGQPAAILVSPDEKLALKMWTDQPSVHGKGFVGL
jgi:aldose 1-epimerase